MSFDTALQATLIHEGGYAEPPRVEQPTNCGITQSTYDKWRVHCGDLPQDVLHISGADVNDIYHDWYWTPSNAQMIHDEACANKYFDFYVTMPPKEAVEILQLACGDCGHPTIIDGEMGPNTIASANGCAPQNLLEALKQRAVEYYRTLVNRRPEKSKWVKGWLERAAS